MPIAELYRALHFTTKYAITAYVILPFASYHAS